MVSLSTYAILTTTELLNFLGFFFLGTGFSVKVATSDNYVKRDSGLILWDIAVGEGDSPKDGQQVQFDNGS